MEIGPEIYILTYFCYLACSLEICLSVGPLKYVFNLTVIHNILRPAVLGQCELMYEFLSSE